MNIEFRDAEVNDIDQLNIVSLAAKGHWGYPEEWLDKWKGDLKINETHVTEHSITIIEVNEEVVGFCCIGENKEVYELMHLWILPSFIGRGLGKLLLDEAVRKAVVKDKKIITEADPNAQGFYERQGFKKVGEIESYPKGRFLPVMER